MAMQPVVERGNSANVQTAITKHRTICEGMHGVQHASSHQSRNLVKPLWRHREQPGCCRSSRRRRISASCRWDLSLCRWLVSRLLRYLEPSSYKENTLIHVGYSTRRHAI